MIRRVPQRVRRAGPYASVVGMPGDQPYTAENVRDWLHTTGGPFEMRVADQMISRNLYCLQGRYYVDPDEGKQREIDVVASTAFAVGESAVMQLVVVIECKQARTPWVLYERGHRELSVLHRDLERRIGTDLGILWAARARSISAVTDRPFWTAEDQPIGYALGISKPEASPRNVDESAAYKACMSVTKATHALADEYSGRAIRCLGVFAPVIAIRGQLFVAELLDREVNVRPIDRGQLVWNSPAHEVLIDVVTEDALDGYADELVEAWNGMRDFGRDAAREVLAAADA